MYDMFQNKLNFEQFSEKNVPWFNLLFQSRPESQTSSVPYSG